MARPARPTLRRPRLWLLLTLGAVCLTVGSQLTSEDQQQLPARLTDQAFWKLVTDLSEAGGYFRSDNFLSNEQEFQHVIPTLREQAAEGGVYLGVGPEQNFTYIVALKPRMAFIFDIRRQNMLQHLLYKALIEMSTDRADFLSRLFSRPHPARLHAGAEIGELLQVYRDVPADSLLFKNNLVAVKDYFRRNKYTLSTDDLEKIEYVYGAFFLGGPDITYSFGRGSYGWRRMPTYADLMTETDGRGDQRSFLASEANFRTLQTLERNNLIIPVVGDFAGSKAIRAVGKYLKHHGATVTAFYTSNVEQYLFRQDDDWRKFYGNVATLPLNDASTFIRAVFNYGGYRFQDPNPGPRSSSLLCPIAELLSAFYDGRVQTYYDVIQMSR